MNAIDVVLVGLVIGVAALETKRGFGKAIFDLAALVIDVKLVSFLAPPAAAAIHIQNDLPASEAIWFGVFFVLFGVILLFIGKLVYNSTLLSLDIFDPFLGGVVGVALAVIVGHAIVKALATAAAVGGVPPEVLRHSAFGMEFYQFTNYHKVMDFLTSLGH